MANKYYKSGDQRAAKVGDLFAAIAPRYDLLNDLQSFGLHRRWKRRLVRLANPQPGERALDVCCGTGDIAFALADAGAEVTGLDFSQAMLQVARQRSAARRVDPRAAASPPQFTQGDALQLPFSDRQFDIVTVGYGLRNLSSWETGLREMWRVAKPGGRLLVLDFGKPDNAVWRRCYFVYLRWCVPLLGRLFARDAQAYGYILESLQHYPAQRGIEAALRSLSCTDVQVHNLLGGVMSINCGRKV